ncbi:MAG: cardiolipin synthase, partial [Pseudomonadota bacterium]
FCAIRAAQTARTPQGAVGWVVFLMATPLLAVPLYLFLGHHRFAGYHLTRIESERVVMALRAFAARVAPDADRLMLNTRPFETLAGMPVARGNGVDLLIDGEATFDAMFEAIDNASSYILIQFYIVRDDELGQKMRESLAAAVRRGVTVRFITDAIGSYSLPDSYYDSMREAGIEVINPRHQRGPNFRFQLNYRNHRKTLIVDGVTGFVGGHNIGVEYLGQNPEFGRWRDTHVRITGPIVSQLQLIFVEDWHWANGEELLDDLNWQAGTDDRDVNALIVATGPGDRTEKGSLLFYSAIAASTRRVWVSSPYFVPDIDIMSALKHAAMRGVDVRILIPEKADHRLPWLAAFAYFDEIADCGVRIFRYTDGFLHQKAFVVDDTIAAVGTS